jgi:hypothetical protein
MPIVVSFLMVAPFVSVAVEQLYFGTSMPFEEGATLPLNLAEWFPPVSTALLYARTGSDFISATVTQ